MAKRSKKSDQKVTIARNTIIGFVGIIVAALVIIGAYVSFGGGQPGEIVANKDYMVVDNPRPRRPDSPIEVTEFFSYGCIHCKTFDPILEDWLAEQPDDVVLSKQPANFSPAWALLARAFITLEALDAIDQNHTRIFRAIHDAQTQFIRPEQIAEYVDGRGTTADEFMRTFNSNAVVRAMNRAERDQRVFGISATPMLVVNGKYVVGMDGGQGRALDVVEHLIAMERTPEPPPAQ